MLIVFHDELELVTYLPFLQRCQCQGLGRRERVAGPLLRIAGTRLQSISLKNVTRFLLGFERIHGQKVLVKNEVEAIKVVL
jgi:hypothetical protein